MEPQEVFAEWKVECVRELEVIQEIAHCCKLAPKTEASIAISRAHAIGKQAILLHEIQEALEAQVPLHHLEQITRSLGLNLFWLHGENEIVNCVPTTLSQLARQKFKAAGSYTRNFEMLIEFDKEKSQSLPKAQGLLDMEGMRPKALLAQRSLELIGEMERCIQPTDLSQLSEPIKRFLRSTGTNDTDVIYYDMMQTNTSPQQLECILRNALVQCFLIALPITEDQRQFLAVPEGVTHQLVVSCAPYTYLAGDLFKEAGSYEKNFRALKTASVVGVSDPNNLDKLNEMFEGKFNFGTI